MKPILPFLTFLLLALLTLPACSESSSETGQATNGTDSSVLTAPVDYLGALNKGQQAANKTVDSAALNKAVQMFFVDNGRYPKDLEEVVQEKYLPQMPQAPYGMKIQYDPTKGQVKIVPQ